MTKPVSFRKNKLLLEGILLYEISKKFSRSITEDAFFDTKNQLEYCVKDLPAIIKEYNDAETKIDRMKKFIQMRAIVEECREYLEFLARVRKGNVAPILNELDRFTMQIELNHSTNYN